MDRIHQDRPDPPEPSCVSMASDRSKEDIINFKEGDISPEQRFDQDCVQWLKPGLSKYACVLTLDADTAHCKLKLSANRKAIAVQEDQSYPDHPERFEHYKQLLCQNGLTGRCYWEVSCHGWVCVALTNRRIRRRGYNDDCGFGWNNHSWSLYFSSSGCIARHNSRETNIHLTSSFSNRVAVYVDCPAGTLSFYTVSSDKLIHLHTFNTTFTEPLYAGFGIFECGNSVALCQL